MMFGKKKINAGRPMPLPEPEPIRYTYSPGYWWLPQAPEKLTGYELTERLKKAELETTEAIKERDFARELLQEETAYAQRLQKVVNDRAHELAIELIRAGKMDGEVERYVLSIMDESERIRKGET